MKQYGTEKSCPKCGNFDIDNCWILISYDTVGHVQDLIDRFCKNCGYRWAEAALDNVNIKPDVIE